MNDIDYRELNHKEICENHKRLCNCECRILCYARRLINDNKDISKNIVYLLTLDNIPIEIKQKIIFELRKSINNDFDKELEDLANEIRDMLSEEDYSDNDQHDFDYIDYNTS